MSKPKGNITVGYVDLASFDKIDAVMYGGEKVRTPFSRGINKHSWYTHLVAPMTMTGQADSPSAQFSKTPDFALMTWAQVTLPRLTVTDPLYRIAYSWNLGHNIWKGGSLAFNDLNAQTYDSTLLDFLSQYRTDAAKWSLYQKFIGNTNALQKYGSELPSATIKLPTPYWFARDSSYALPLCCASLNNITENYSVETDLSKLIRVQKNMAADPNAGPAIWVDQKAGSLDFSSFISVEGNKAFEVPMTQTWAKYVLVTDEEREQHQDEQRDVIIEQFQKINGKKEGAGEHRLEFHFTNPVKALFFGFANKTSEEYNNRSNYTDSYKAGGGVDPASSTSLIYENQARFERLPGDMFDMDTWLHGARGISEVGYHALFYCMHINDLEMTGSSDFSNLITTLESECSESSGEGNTYSLVIRALSAHRVRFKSLSFGFPAL